MGWLRKLSLNIYVNNRLFKTYNSDGTRNTLDIEFSIEKTLTGEPNESTVVISNMSPDVKSSLMGNAMSSNSKIFIELFAGYEDKGLELLSCGDLMKLWPEKQGSSNTFTLSYLDGFFAVQDSHYEGAVPGNTALSSVVLELAKSFEKNGIKVDPTKINVEGTVPLRGMTFYGRTASTLDILALVYNFTWSIQDGVFQAYMDGGEKQPSQAVYQVSLSDRNLLKATPEIGEKYMQQTGMKIEAILNPKCKCGDLIQLGSEIYPQFNGDYTIHNLTFTGGTKTSDWKMVIDSKTLTEQSGE